MKKLHLTIALLFAAVAAATAMLLILSPDIIPAHYNFAGEVDRYGSKYESLIFPGLSLLTTGILFVVYKGLQKKNAPQVERRSLLYAVIFTLALFLALQLFFGIAAIRHPGGEQKMMPGVVRITEVAIGALLLVCGAVIPKTPRNAVLGLRTKWSMANDRVWQKSQSFCGKLALVCGLVLLVSAVAAPDAGFAVLLVSGLLWAAASTAASYLFWKKDREA